MTRAALDWTPEKLRLFEQDIAECFNDKQIRAPVHLEGNNEEQLIRIFQEVNDHDWVCGSWRMHYKTLLKGVPPGILKSAILAGRSIALCFPEHRVISSAIVGGILPIALGLAWSIKRADGSEKVWCFCGDMTARGGMFHECFGYARGWTLPITFVEEDNGKSVCTPTKDVWGPNYGFGGGANWQHYEYELPWPHAGAGTRVQF